MHAAMRIFLALSTLRYVLLKRAADVISESMKRADRDAGFSIENLFAQLDGAGSTGTKYLVSGYNTKILLASGHSKEYDRDGHSVCSPSASNNVSAIYNWALDGFLCAAIVGGDCAHFTVAFVERYQPEPLSCLF